MSEWLRSMVYKTVPPEVEISELISVLRQGAQALTGELSSGTNTILFRNLLSGDPTGKEAEKVARYAAGYLLLNQIAFYRVLSHYRGYTKLNEGFLEKPSDLQRYFNEVLKDNYYPIFSFRVTDGFTEASLPIV